VTQAAAKKAATKTAAKRIGRGGAR
jgi:hypothetical protein